MEKVLKIVIVGGVAGGASAAAKARREDESADIVVLEKGPYVSFANCGLPYHLSKQIPERDALFVASPELFRDRFNIDVRVNSEVTAIDRRQKRVLVADRTGSRQYEESYDRLILATGADPIVPSIPGIDSQGVFTLKTVTGMDKAIQFIKERSPKSAAVVGGGFIGLEAAEALHELGLEVTIVEATDQILPSWDPEIAEEMERYILDELWIEVLKGDPLIEIAAENDSVSKLILESGETVQADIVILAIGVRPNNALAKKADIAVNDQGLIITDSRMQTSDPNIFAAGDAVQSIHRLTGAPCWLPLAGPANRQGRAAGANAAGGNIAFPGVIGTAIVRVGKIAAARTGLGEKEAKALDRPHFIAYAIEKSHAEYYPGAEELLLKLVVEKESGKLIGAQAVGGDGVDKRIDVLACAIASGMSVWDLVDLELSYAPPFGSAKDPVNVAAMVAVNILEGRTKPVTWEALYADDPLPLILDVRSPGERKTVYVKGTTHIDIDALRSHVAELEKDAPIRIYCRIGKRGYFAEQVLKGLGFKDVKQIAGGWRTIWGALREDYLIGDEPRN
jgi:NADPH-dependent 2,4-dienoyl-CoA reductase/sulfur reductase-like enzyme/rhodanese-related sulfurtransferase